MRIQSKKDYLLSDIRELKKIIKGEVLEDFPLANITSFEVGGEADIFIFPQDEEDIINLIDFAKSLQIPLTFIGRGTNLLVRDRGIRGIVVSLKKGLKDFRFEGKSVIVGAGVSMPFFSKLLMEHGISGFEFAWGIPGTIGGATVMNAGAFGATISDYIEEVITITYDGKKNRYSKEELEFSYRDSILRRKKEIVLSVRFSVREKGDPNLIFEKMKEISRIRRETQPIGAKTAGSIFKNPKGYYAGKLIEDAGLKGIKMGGARVSWVHANFIENTGNASAKDIEELILYIKKVIKEKTGITLLEEVEIIGCKD